MRSLYSLALLTVAVTASPADPWHHRSHPGWQKPSVYTPSNPKTTLFASYPYHHPSKTTSAPTGTSSASKDACASIAGLVAPMQSASPSATPTVPAQLAYDCITSIPFNSSAAVALLDSMRPYIKWQTTIEYLKDPPAEYAEKVQPAYDFYGAFDDVYNKAKAGDYANEYEFGVAVYTTFQTTHDGHFVFLPDSSTGIFTWGRTTPLVSVSTDGTSIPEVYVYADVLSASFGNASFTPSPLMEINGQNSTEWLLNFSQVGSLQDRDALWNNMFYLLAQVSLGPSGTGTGTFSGGGRGRWVYPGATTTLKFANGTSVTNENFARVLAPFANITTGEDIYQTFFVPPPGEPQQIEPLATSTMPTTSATTATPTSTSTASSTTIPAPGYPSPIIREMSNLNSGYFLESDGYDDVAVLSVPSFVGTTPDEIPFQAVNTYLINQAVASGKKKLIIDVSANGGGTILQGYDLFKQLFPSVMPYGATRFRAHEAVDYIGQEISAFSGMVPRSLNTNATVQNLVSTPFNYRTDADVNYHPFPDWKTKYGPHQYGPEPDNFTSIIRWNLSDVLTPDNSGGIYVSGYLNRSNITTQPFDAENIVIMTDGYCASTCTIFSELMTQQGHVKKIAMGGRPNLDITQAVGGVKGTNDFPWDYILALAEVPFQYQYVHDADFYNSTELGDYTDLPFFRASGDPVVNARDGIRQGDTTGTPLQFVYEPADCRILYTPEMAVDVTAQWKAVADTAFNGKSQCVAGSGFNGPTASRRFRERQALAQKWQVSRRGIDRQSHFDSISNVWTGMGGITLSGDGFMLP